MRKLTFFITLLLGQVIGLANNLPASLPFDQQIIMPIHPDSPLEVVITDCAANNTFVSDGEHLYEDAKSRQDEVVICPDQNNQLITVSFQEFDLSAGDTLYVYDGANTGAPLIVAGGGNGTANLNGSWITANCDPNINPGRCLTFVFATNGDNQKGTGWKANIRCEENQQVQLSSVPDIFRSTPCDSLQRTVNLRMPTLTTTGSSCAITDSQIVVSFCGTRDTLDTGQLINPVFPIGQFQVNYHLLADSTIRTFSHVYISPPGFACNDTIYTAIGQGCVATLQPDDFLEDGCDFDNNVLQSFSISVVTDKGVVTGTDKNPPRLDAGPNGNITCNRFYRVGFVRTLESSPNNACSQIAVDSCSALVQFVDGVRPVFINIKKDTLVGCYDGSASSSILTTPTVIDNCELTELYPTFPPGFNTSCTTTEPIEVIWTAVDACGNTSTATQEVILKRPEFFLTPPDTTLGCGDLLTPAITGWPGIDSDGDGRSDVTITDEGSYCSLFLTYQDQRVKSTCLNGNNVLRIFSLYDECLQQADPIYRDTQYIYVRDEEAPKTNCPEEGALGSASNPLPINASSRTCRAYPVFTLPAGTDNCNNSDELITRIEGIYRLSDGYKIAAYWPTTQPLAPGAYRLAYRLEDGCGNRSEICNYYFDVVDKTTPTAVCSDELVVSLSTGSVTITPEDVSKGTYDYCGIATILLRRKACGEEDNYTHGINQYVLEKLQDEELAAGWSSSIEIACCDIGKNVEVQVIVFDQYGNYNRCWLNIVTENQPQTVCSNLPDQTGFCDDYNLPDLGADTDTNDNHAFDENEWQPVDEALVVAINEQFGNPACNLEYTCSGIGGIEQEYQLLKKSCGEQIMRRRFRTQSHNDGVTYPWYYQNITLTYRPNWSFTLPADTVVLCSSDLIGSADLEELHINSGACDQIGWEVKDQVFTGEGDYCLKIFREWHIINGCQHSNIQQPFVLPREEDAEGYVNQNAKRTFSYDEIINGVRLDTIGYFSYRQLILIEDDEAPVIEIKDTPVCIEGSTDGAATNSCRVTRQFSATATDCTDFEPLRFRYSLWQGFSLILSGNGASFDYEVAPGESYRVEFFAVDNCGNTGKASRNFDFLDCQQPTVECQPTTLQLDDSKMATLQAIMLNSNSFDNCTITENLEYRVWHPVLGGEQPFDPEIVNLLPTSIIFDCTSVGESDVYLYVLDEWDNYAVCKTRITINDGEQPCSQAGLVNISGRIQTETGGRMEEVEVYVNNETTSQMVMTNAEGQFSIDLPIGNYNIRPQKEGNIHDGVSTYDLVRIQQHLLNIRLFDSPCQYIAADVNDSKTISVYDMVIIRKLILGIINQFPAGKNWRFYNQKYPASSSNPLTEDWLDYHPIDDKTTREEVEFMAIKLGDIDGSNFSSNQEEQAMARQTQEPLRITAVDQKIIAGQQYEIPFYSEQISTLQGFQFTLEFSGLRFEECLEGLAQAQHFGTHQKERGVLTTSWSRAIPKQDEAPLFQLSFTALTNGQLSDMLQISSTITPAEAYNSNDEQMPVQLVFETAELSATMKVAQNRPNPFKAETVIDFYLPKASHTTFRLMDRVGKIILEENQYYPQGKNQIQLHRANFPSNGVFYYQIISSAGKITKTMLITD